MKTTNMNRNSKFKNVVLISLDCVRPEALGCYEKQFPLRVRVPRGVNTPNIDYLATHGHKFNQAISAAPFTPASHASIFTGLYPPSHGIRTILGSKLHDDIETISELLSSAGWRCGAVVGSGALSCEFGLSKGFEYYDDDIETGKSNWLLGYRRDADEVTTKAIDWLESVSSDKFFLFVHYFDAHTVAEINSGPDNIEKALSSRPISTIRPILQKLRSATFDYFETGVYNFKYHGYGRRFMLAQVAKIDKQLGKLINRLSSLGILDETLIVVTADHGDDFWQHGEADHRKFIYDTTLHVPLIIYPALGNKQVVNEQVSLIDIFPTIISILGIDTNSIDAHGKNLESLFNNGAIGKTSFKNRPVYAETVFESRDNGRAEYLTVYSALRIPPWKLIWDRLNKSFELFNIRDDPSEVVNLYLDHQSIAANLFVQLRELSGNFPIVTENEEDIMYERLKSLGYF